MRTTLLYATLVFFLLGASVAHEIAVSPVLTTHKEVVEYRIVQLDKKIGAICSTNYITTTTNGVKSATRKSMDCEE
jgi:hypothetical protein